MYEFSPVTARIQLMHQLVRDRVIQIDAERAAIVTESYQKNQHVVPIIRRAMTTYALCAKMTVRVEDFELIVGNRAKNFCGSPVSPEWAGSNWIPNDLKRWSLWSDGLYHNPEHEELKLSITPEDAELLCSIQDYWKNNEVTATADAWQPDGYEDFAKLAVSTNVAGYPLMMLTAGHLTPGYQKILNVGYGAIRKEAQDWIDAHKNNLMGEDAEKFLFYKAVVLSCEAATLLLKRYGQACLDKAAVCTDPVRRSELETMGEGLLWISENPARTFWEACQAASSYQLFLAVEGKYPACSFGRFDQYTWPYLKAELESGSITMEKAQEIVDAFFLKANCYYNAAPDFLVKTTGVGNTYQHTTIGGVDPETGEDATNPVSYMVLESVGRLGLHDPTVSLRVNKNSPVRIWDCALETTRLVGGLPLFQNDEVIIPGIMRELGFELKDARNYALIGCQEITGSGNDYSAANGIAPPHASISYSVVLSMAVNNGVNPMNGQQCPIRCGYLYDMQSFEEVKAAFRATASFSLKAQVSINNFTEYLTKYHAPVPGLSISMEGCMESGKDCTWGGSKYYSTGGTATGLATVADSLTTIKYMVYDKKLCTARQLYDAVMANWEGYEVLRQRILSEVPHFGNADPYADEQMKWVCDTYYEICQECSSLISKKFKAGLYGATDHIRQGTQTWATPDGRKTGEPLADASSPAQGRDKNGPTAVFASECCFDHSRFMDGIALNIRIHPSALNSEDGIAKLRDMTKTYMEEGGMEVQYNVVSSDIMRAAQKDPETYKNLVVRIAGFSAYFIDMTPALQNDIISRTENSF